MFREFTPGEENVPQTPPPESGVEKKQFTSEELRQRYEARYRNSVAQKLREERVSLREGKDKIKSAEILKMIERSQGMHEQNLRSFEKTFTQAQSVTVQEIDSIDKQINNLKKRIEERGFLKAAQYRLGKKDDEQEEIERLKSKAQNLITGLRGIRQDTNRHIVSEESKQKRNTESNQEALSLHVQRYQDGKEKLYERTSEINQSSRSAIRETLEALNQGDLDISKLAKEYNAVVVHAIPLDGWSMKNTEMNNKEASTTKMNAVEKMNTLSSLRPDVSASIVSADSIASAKGMFYPFGYILDGKIIASYQNDEGLQADGNSRRKKIEYPTLQSNPKENFGRVVKVPNYSKDEYSESIVHQPSLKAVLIDEVKLLSFEDKGDVVKTIFSKEDGDQEIARLRKLGKNISVKEGVPSTGVNAGKHIVVIERKRTAVEKAIEFAEEHNPSLPVYLRRRNGIFSLSGKKMTAEEIYK